VDKVPSHSICPVAGALAWSSGEFGLGVDHMAITVATPDLNFPITLALPGPKEPRYTVRQEI
jgi:hypothetical protein